MKKLFWLLLAALPLLTGITSGASDDYTISNDGEVIKIKTEIILNEDFVSAKASLQDDPTVMVHLELPLDTPILYDTAQMIAINSLLGSMHSQNNDMKLIGDFWISADMRNIGDFLYPSSSSKENAINTASLVFQFEEVPLDKKLLPIPIRKNHEFSNSKRIRAKVNIQGSSFTGPIVRFDIKPQSINTKKMQAVYALMGKVISAGRGLSFTGVWDGRESLRIPDSSMLFDRRSGNNAAKGTFLGRETDLVDYTGTSSDGTTQFRTVVETLIDFLKKIMVPIAIILVAYSGIELFLSFQNEEKMDAKIRHLTGILVGFLIMTLAVNIVDWVIFGHEGEIMRGDIDVAEFAQRGFQEVSGLFDMFSAFAVIIAVGFIVYNAITLIIAGGEDESQISEIKKRILYSMIGIIILVSAKPLIDVFTANGQLVMPEVRGTITIVAKWINFLLGFIGVAAVLAMIYAGIGMIIQFGDETAIEKSKKIMISAAIGLIMAFSSWALIYYFIFAG